MCVCVRERERERWGETVSEREREMVTCNVVLEVVSGASHPFQAEQHFPNQKVMKRGRRR